MRKPKPRYSVSRSGMGGRPAGEYPARVLRVACDEQEFMDIQTLSPRERAAVLLDYLKRETTQTAP